MGRFFLRRWFAQSLKDIEPGDAVRIVGFRGVAFVESVTGDQALVMVARDRRHILPLNSLRRVRGVRGDLDRRR